MDSIDVSIDVAGHVFVNKQALVNSQLHTIREAMRDAMLDLKEPSVIISADANTTHQMVVRVMDAARQLGLVKITFETQVPEDDSE